jgi:hypothetical protein
MQTDVRAHCVALRSSSCSHPLCHCPCSSTTHYTRHMYTRSSTPKARHSTPSCTHRHTHTHTHTQLVWCVSCAHHSSGSDRQMATLSTSQAKHRHTNGTNRETASRTRQQNGRRMRRPRSRTAAGARRAELMSEQEVGVRVGTRTGAERKDTAARVFGCLHSFILLRARIELTKPTRQEFSST